MNDGSLLHFIVSLLLVLTTPFFFKNKILGLGIVLIATLFLGIGKEVYDNMVNPWHLSPTALVSDTESDLYMDCLGIITGFVIFIILGKK